MSRFFLLLASGALIAAGCAGGAPQQTASAVQPVQAPVQANDSYYTKAGAAVDARAAERGIKRAKNVILFVGDGMGVSTITAGRIFAGQQKGVDGESYRLAMESLPYSALVKTYTHDAQVADSAPTAAAMTTGVKSANGTIGVTQAADLRNCATAKTAATNSLWEIAEEAGLATGVVSTARFTHATPAATYAKTTERDWESDGNISAEGKAAGCIDIAAQFVAWDHGDGMEVALGGGRAQFLPATAADPEYATRRGARQDGRDLMAEWKAKDARRQTITDAAGFSAINFDSDVQVFGLFEPSHMQYEADRAGDGKGEPSLAGMTRAAITRLSRNPNGYVLMVEGGRIDHAHHAGNAARALADTAALDEAVAAAVAATDPAETLIVVTADHSHTFVIQGYPGRNNNILDVMRYPGESEPGRGADGKPFTTLTYTNGPGSVCKRMNDVWTCERDDLSDIDTTALDYLQQSLVPLNSETHGGEDVALFASGPGANLFSGVIEQNEIFHVMAKSLGLVR